MGLRSQRPRWETEEITVPYMAGAAPQTAGLIQQQGDQRLQQVQQSEEAQQRARESQFQMQGQIGQTRARGDEALAQGIVGGVTQGVEQYGKAKERGERSRLTEEQLAASKQQREIAAQEEQRRQERAPVELQGLQAQTDVAKATASRITKEEEFENAIADAEDALPSETNRAYKARKEIETTGYNAQTARQQLKVQEQQILIAEQQLAQAKDMAPLEKERIRADIAARKAELSLAQRNIAELDRQKEIKEATNIIQAEMSAIGGDPQLKMQRLQAAAESLRAKGVPPAYVAEAINNANANEQQKMFMAVQMDRMLYPEKEAERQFAVQNLLKGKQDYITFKKATNELQNALERYKNSSALPDTEGKAALEQLIGTLESVGETELANDLRSPVGGLDNILPGTPAFFGRTERIQQAIGILQQKWGQQLKALEKDDPRFGKMGEEIAGMKYQPIRGPNIARNLVQGLFQAPGQATATQSPIAPPPQQFGPSGPGMTPAPQMTVNQLQSIPGFKMTTPAKVGGK